MENIKPKVVEGEEDKEVSPVNLLASESSADYLKSWPVQLPVPTTPIYIKGARQPRRKPYRFRYTYMKNWLVPLDGPMSIEHVHFLLDCFVVSAGPVPPQLGRYHPQSDPEEFVRKDITPQEDTWSLKSEEEDNFWSKVGVKPMQAGEENAAAIGPGTSSMISWPEDDDEFTFENYFPSALATNKAEPRRPLAPMEFFSTDEFISRELTEMRLVLERLLDNHEVMDWDPNNGLRDVLELLPTDTSPKELSLHYPVGDWEFLECEICLDSQWLYRRACCRFPACSTCLQNYFSFQIENGLVKIECPNTECNAFVHRNEISARLSLADKERFNKLLILANQDANTKTCPRCSHLTQIMNKPKAKREGNYPIVTCSSCELEWCFNCHAPRHGALSCRQFQKGDRLLRSWARERNHGQINAQKCPKCKIYIQRTTGCDHMHCTRCRTDFCYKCGERFRYLKFFGDHYSKLSIFGCRYRFKADQPFQRKMIRGAIFGGKLIAAPLLGALALCAGAIVVGVSLFALPVYGGVRLYRHCEGRSETTKVLRRYPPTYHIPNVNLQLSHSFP